jgi:hypothetical protein
VQGLRVYFLSIYGIWILMGAERVRRQRGEREEGREEREERGEGGERASNPMNLI